MLCTANFCVFFSWIRDVKLVPHFPVLHFPPLHFQSCIFWSRIFRSCIFLPWKFGPSFSSPVDRSLIYTVRHKKLHHFVFAITLSYLSLFEYLLVHIYRDKFWTNWHQNHQSHLKGVFILLCEMQHTYTCYDQRRFSHVGLNVITIVLTI